MKPTKANIQPGQINRQEEDLYIIVELILQQNLVQELIEFPKSKD